MHIFQLPPHTADCKVMKGYGRVGVYNSGGEEALINKGECIFFRELLREKLKGKCIGDRGLEIAITFLFFVKWVIEHNKATKKEAHRPISAKSSIYKQPNPEHTYERKNRISKSLNN